ncbi:MAG: glycosyltransferase family 39 protein [FCB group bacterium]|nr:glycosyltransferase family 39 protein [FCB group bacterium]
MDMNSYRKSLTIFLIFFIFLEISIIIAGSIVRPQWGLWHDEAHFYKTIQTFEHDISLDNIKHYQEMSTPLPFVIYALWGRLFGADIFHLRILSLIIALITYLIFHRILYLLFNGTKAFWGTSYLAINPYMIGLSIFVFTDMMAILFLVLALFFLIRKYSILFGLSMAAAILCRQYMIFFTFAVFIYSGWRYLHTKDKKSLSLFISNLLALIPMIFLIILWGGLSPVNNLRKLYMDEAFIFHPKILTLYISLLFIYFVPILFYYRKRIYTNYRIILLSFLLSLFYVVYPIKTSNTLVPLGVSTVGLFNRFLQSVFDNQLFVHFIFYFSFFLALPIIIFLLKDVYYQIKGKNYNLYLLIDLSIFSFYIIMPFSYLGWEKYFVPLIPFVIIRLFMINYSEKEPVKVFDV